MSLLPPARRNRPGGPPTSLGLCPDGYSPRADRHFWSSKTERYIYPFKPVGPYPLAPPVADCNEDRAYPSGHRPAEAGRDTRHRSDARRTCSFSGTAPSKPNEDRLDKGFQNLGKVNWPKAKRGRPGPFWRPFGHFSGEGKVTRGLGPGRPQWQALGRVAPA